MKVYKVVTIGGEHKSSPVSESSIETEINKMSSQGWRFVQMNGVVGGEWWYMVYLVFEQDK